MQPETQVDLLEVVIAGKHVADSKVEHDNYAGEIDKGNVRLVVVALPQLPCSAKLLR
jgi:hypothetical protein